MVVYGPKYDPCISPFRHGLGDPHPEVPAVPAAGRPDRHAVGILHRRLLRHQLRQQDRGRGVLQHRPGEAPFSFSLI